MIELHNDQTFAIDAHSYRWGTILGCKTGAVTFAAATPSAQLAGNTYVININQNAKFVKEGMRVGVDRPTYSI